MRKRFTDAGGGRKWSLNSVHNDTFSRKKSQYIPKICYFRNIFRFGPAAMFWSHSFIIPRAFMEPHVRKKRTWEGCLWNSVIERSRMVKRTLSWKVKLVKLQIETAPLTPWVWGSVRSEPSDRLLRTRTVSLYVQYLYSLTCVPSMYTSTYSILHFKHPGHYPRTEALSVRVSL